MSGGGPTSRGAASREPGRDPAELPVAARLVLRAERRLRGGKLPRFMRRGGHPSTPSRGTLLLIMVAAGSGAVLLLSALPSRPALRVVSGPAVAAVWAGALVAVEPGRLSSRRFGPWLPAVGWWLSGLVVLELFVEGLARPRFGATVLQTVLMGAMGLVAWGKARIDLDA